MIVVVIMGILLSVAMQRFATIIRHAKEGATLGSLGGIRSAVMIYYADMEGQYPGSMAALTVAGKFISVIPQAKTPFYHADTSTVVLGGGECVNTRTHKVTAQTKASCLKTANRKWVLYRVTDAGGWTYANDPATGNWGDTMVNCSHTDNHGSMWTSY
jgi:type II secretory pathway pseudopilin PulG